MLDVARAQPLLQVGAGAPLLGRVGTDSALSTRIRELDVTLNLYLRLEGCAGHRAARARSRRGTPGAGRQAAARIRLAIASFSRRSPLSPRRSSRPGASRASARPAASTRRRRPEARRGERPRARPRPRRRRPTAPTAATVDVRAPRSAAAGAAGAQLAQHAAARRDEPRVEPAAQDGDGPFALDRDAAACAGRRGRSATSRPPATRRAAGDRARRRRREQARPRARRRAPRAPRRATAGVRAATWIVRPRRPTSRGAAR